MRPLNLAGTTEVSPLGGEGNKPLFPFRLSLKLFFLAVLGLTALPCPTLPWFQVCQLVLPQDCLCYPVTSHQLGL